MTEVDQNIKRFVVSALMKRMYKYGLLNESENKLDYVLGLTVHRFMDRRL